MRVRPVPHCSSTIALLLHYPNITDSRVDLDLSAPVDIRPLKYLAQPNLPPSDVKQKKKVSNPKPTTLAPRGHRLATGPASTIRAMFEQIMLDEYDPDKNPNGIASLQPTAVESRR